MRMLRHFFICYFTYNSSYEELDDIIKDFKKNKTPADCLELITELHHIIQTKNYAFANKIIEETKFWSFKKYLKDLEKLLNYIYDRLIDRPTTVKAIDLIDDVKRISCPSCSPEDGKESAYRLIEKATITKNNMIIYLCKPCSLIWLTEDISLENARDYKEYMKSLGLNGAWKELQDREIY